MKNNKYFSTSIENEIIISYMYEIQKKTELVAALQRLEQPWKWILEEYKARFGDAKQKDS